jgi:hypothetical protein
LQIGGLAAQTGAVIDDLQRYLFCNIIEKSHIKL